MTVKRCPPIAMSFVILYLALVVGTAMAQQAPSGPARVLKTLHDKELTSFRALVESSGAYNALATPAAKFTMLAPTNEAVLAFVSSMGMNLDELKQQEQLVDDIVAYHIVLGFLLRPADVLAIQDRFKGAVPVYSLARPWYHSVMEKDGKIIIKDAQGNVARPTRTLEHGNHIVHVIDKVLFSGNYFTTLESLFKNFPSSTSATAQAMKAAGLSDLLSRRGFADTIFIPDNKAMAKLDIQTYSEKELKSLFELHMLKGKHVIPQGFKDGQMMMTMLPGQSIAVDSSAGVSGDFVTDASGQKADITKANIFVSRGVAHGIASVLQPAKTASSAAATGAATPAQVTAAVTTPSTLKAQQTTAVSSKSSMTGFVAKIFAHKAAVVNTMSGSKPRAVVVAIDAPAISAKATGASGRKLLQAAAPAWANPDVQGNQQHLDDNAITMGEQEDAIAAIAAAEDPTQADPSIPAVAGAQTDTGKSISEATSDTRNQELAQDQISGVADASNADPTLPAWVRPSLSTGKYIGDASATRDEADAEGAVSEAVAAYDSGTCC